MDIERPRRRPAQESTVPMINVVFLLLVFFLMASQIAPPAPAEVTVPRSAGGDEPAAEARLYLDAGGVLYFRDAAGDAALAALRQGAAPPGRLLLSADRRVEAARLAGVLRQLAGLGVPRVELVVAPR